MPTSSTPLLLLYLWYHTLVIGGSAANVRGTIAKWHVMPEEVHQLISQHKRKGIKQMDEYGPLPLNLQALEKRLRVGQTYQITNTAGDGFSYQLSFDASSCNREKAFIAFTISALPF
jgi:hypothetical protein